MKTKFTIKDITNSHKGKKLFNKDLFTADSEIIDLGQFQEDKQISLYSYKVTSDGTLDSKGDLIGLKTTMVAILPDNSSKTKFGIYLYNISQRVYNNEEQLSIYRQPLTIKGFHWILKSNDYLSTATNTQKEHLYKIYRLVLSEYLDNNLITNWNDFKELFVITPKGWYRLELENDREKIVISLDPDGFLFDISIGTLDNQVKEKVKIKPLVEDDLEGLEDDNQEEDEIFTQSKKVITELV